jgi:hypothetical protein
MAFCRPSFTVALVAVVAALVGTRTIQLAIAVNNDAPTRSAQT